MNLTLILEVAILVLNLIVIGFWKPWAGAYGGEKGKNLARQEDLEKLLTEMKTVTAGQEEIKAKFAGDLWNKKRLWSQKREMYVDVITSVHEMSNNYAILADTLKSIGETNPEQPNRKTLDMHLLKQYNEIIDARGALARASTLLFIFGSKAAIEALARIGNLSEPGGNITFSKAEEFVKRTNACHNALVEEARKEFTVSLS